jgi:hypothetical protein
MECPQDKHKIEIFLTCEMYERLCEAAQVVGCRNDLERYVKALLADVC